MTLTYDTKARIPATALSTTTSAANANYTCGANAKVLVVMVHYAGVTQRTGGAPTYDSVALTQVESPAGVTEASCELWYMLNPPTGSALAVNVPNNNGVTMWVYVASGNAADGYTCAVDDTGITETTGASPSVSVTTLTAGCLIFACVATGDNTFSPTARTGSSLYEEDIAAYGSAAQYYVMAGTGAQALSWTDATSDDYGALAVAFKEIEDVTARTVSKTEAISVSDTPTVDKLLLDVSKSESVNVGDTPTLMLIDNVNATESIAVIDGPRYYTDEIIVTDQPTVQVSSNINISESIDVEDVPTIELSTPQISVNESIDIEDAPAVELSASGIAVSESINVVDAPNINALAIDINVTDAISVSDIPTIEIEQETPREINVSENIAVTDGPRYYTDEIIVSDYAIVEIVTPAGGHSIEGVSDNITVTDAPVLFIDLNISVSEIITVSENDFYGWGELEIAVTDSIAVTDIPTVEKEGIASLAIAVSESIAVTDTPSIEKLGLNVSLSESIGVTDASMVFLAQDFSIFVSETITITDTPDIEKLALNVSVSESIWVMDAPTVFLAQDFSIFVSETINVTELITLQCPSGIMVSETIHATDNASVFIAEDFAIYVSETIQVTDNISTECGIGEISITELITIDSQVAIAALELDCAVIENINITDVVMMWPVILAARRIEFEMTSYEIEINQRQAKIKVEVV